ncbi:uncharacterized protein CPUR_00933 [Claviceps purpurea 20.1]|uniref:Uncharacterized protein n=1 Tax=Claviceps purpurea (strain 20.1) TaxID=1111077 RepID=M1WA30_CLAP2|nr:uncharacterized protein CPUR_00933 [Claviceps purpurea 20.1]
MDPVAREVWLKAWKRDIDPSRCLLMHMPREIKALIIFHLDLDVLSRLGQSCRAWYQVTLPELYGRDAKEGRSSAIRWMASQAVDEERTEIALNTLEISARFGGQVDVISEQHEGQTLYETPTALHYAIIRRNLRLAKKLLDMGARHDIPCLHERLIASLHSSYFSDVLIRLHYFTDFFRVRNLNGQIVRNLNGQSFPIFLAFMRKDPDMGQLLVDRGAGREGMISPPFTTAPTRIPILHLLASEDMGDIGQWRFLFDHFREHINERCTEEGETLLHTALRCGAIQNVQIVLEAGVNMEVQNAALLTPLVALVQVWTIQNQRHVACIRKFVELGSNIHPGGDSVMVHVMKYYRLRPEMWSDIRHTLNFFLDHGADLNERSLSGTNVVSQLIPTICHAAPAAMEALEELLHDLIDKGLDLRSLPQPLEERSALCTVIIQKDAQPAWLFDLLCKQRATILDEEADDFFCRWFEVPRLRMGNQLYNIWQHAEQISPDTADRVYNLAISYDTPSFFDLLVRTLLIIPPVLTLASMAFDHKKKWSWSSIVAREFKGNFTTWDLLGQESMLHRTVRFYKEVPDYSAADAIRDISKLMRDGMDITIRNEDGRHSLDLLLLLACSKTDCSELVAFLERELDLLRCRTRSLKRIR